MMKKNKSKELTKAERELEKWRQAFRLPPVPVPACPEPEQVISAALQELAPPQQEQIQEHLLNCRDCLDLYLDVRSARAEAGSPADQKFEEPAAAAPSSKPAMWGRKILETVRTLGRPRRLIPALAAVSLVVFLVILGREEKSGLGPSPQLAMKEQVAPTAPPSAVPSHDLYALKSVPAPPGSGRMAARKQAENSNSRQKESFSIDQAATPPIRLEAAAVPDNGARLSYRADQDCYVYLLREDQNGKFELLEAGRIEAGKTYYYPDRGRLSESDTGPPATVFLVASPGPVMSPEVRLKKLKILGKEKLPLLFPGATIKSFSIRLP